MNIRPEFIRHWHALRFDDDQRYPLHPKRNAEIGDAHWSDAPTQLKGDHDGSPDALRANPVDPD